MINRSALPIPSYQLLTCGTYLPEIEVALLELTYSFKQFADVSLQSAYNICFIEVRCAAPGSPENGTSDGDLMEYSYLDNITFSCDIGFILKGSKRVTCNANEEWSDSVPICQRKFLCRVVQLNLWLSPFTDPQQFSFSYCKIHIVKYIYIHK